MVQLFQLEEGINVYSLHEWRFSQVLYFQTLTFILIASDILCSSVNKNLGASFAGRKNILKSDPLKHLCSE